MDTCVENVPSCRAIVSRFREGRKRLRSKSSDMAAKWVKRRPCIVYVQVDAFYASLDPCDGSMDRMRGILEAYTPTVETAGSGAFYLDFSASEQHDSHLETTLLRLQMEVLGHTGLRVRIGAGRTRIMALLAARAAQPRGVRIVNADSETTVLAMMAITNLDRIGDIDARALMERGISTIGELRSLPKPVLVAAFGKALGVQLWFSARGQNVPPTRRGWASRHTSIIERARRAMASIARGDRRKTTGFAELAGGTPSPG